MTKSGQDLEISLVKDINTGWWKKFEELLKHKNIKYKLIEIEKNDWIEQIGSSDFVIWRPNLNEPFLEQAREKIYFLEVILQKKVYPSLSTFWHYNNKNSEYYIGKAMNIKMPQGFVSYSYEDTLEYLKKSRYPIVSKSKAGAASQNVRLLKNFHEAKRELDCIFHKRKTRDFLNKLFKELKFSYSGKYNQSNYVNFQEFIPDSKFDLRITVIGAKYAYAFYRKNRKNDFRASGSGIINYDISDFDTDCIDYFINLNKKLNFDSMAYDILSYKNDFYVIEFSYTFIDKALFNCPGYFKLESNKLEFITKQTWPQELILNHLSAKWQIPELLTN